MKKVFYIIVFWKKKKKKKKKKVFYIIVKKKKKKKKKKKNALLVFWLEGLSMDKNQRYIQSMHILGYLSKNNKVNISRVMLCVFTRKLTSATYVKNL